MRKAADSAWRTALARLAHARSLSWACGATTEAAWEAVRVVEEGLLAPAPTPPLVAEKLHYLLAVMQPPATAALRLPEQPWRHRLLQSAIDDIGLLQAALRAAETECCRLRRAASTLASPARTVPDVARQLADTCVELQEARAERDAALDAVARLNQRQLAARVQPATRELPRH